MARRPSSGLPVTAARACAALAPVADHLLEVADQQVGGGRQIGGAPVAVAAGAVGLIEVGRRPVAGAGPGAVQVLAPQQELDRVVAGRDIGLDLVDLVQRAQQVGIDGRRVELLAARRDLRVGDHVGRVEVVVVRLVAVARRDVVDQPLVERPGVHLALPVVDDRVAEPVDLGLLVGHARREPRARAPPPGWRRSAPRPARRSRPEAPAPRPARPRTWPGRCRHRSRPPQPDRRNPRQAPCLGPWSRPRLAPAASNSLCIMMPPLFARTASRHRQRCARNSCPVFFRMESSGTCQRYQGNERS